MFPSRDNITVGFYYNLILKFSLIKKKKKRWKFMGDQSEQWNIKQAKSVNGYSHARAMTCAMGQNGRWNDLFSFFMKWVLYDFIRFADGLFLMEWLCINWFIPFHDLKDQKKYIKNKRKLFYLYRNEIYHFKIRWGGETGNEERQRI